MPAKSEREKALERQSALLATVWLLGSLGWVLAADARGFAEGVSELLSQPVAEAQRLCAVLAALYQLVWAVVLNRWGAHLENEKRKEES